MDSFAIRLLRSSNAITGGITTAKRNKIASKVVPEGIPEFERSLVASEPRATPRV
jgi:hypothetical protein